MVEKMYWKDDGSRRRVTLLERLEVENELERGRG
jgi:hypothetical protein